MPRASWRGFLRLSLVTCPVYLSPATSAFIVEDLLRDQQLPPGVDGHETYPFAPGMATGTGRGERGRVTGSECRAAGFGIIGTAARHRPYQP